MVCQWGMSDVLGPVTFGRREEQIFLGREIAQHRDYSEDTARMIDDEVKKILQNAEERAIKILTEHRDMLDLLAQRLLEKEVLSGHDIDILIGREGSEDIPAPEPAPEVDG
jgi:cell division protease FtsH